MGPSSKTKTGPLKGQPSISRFFSPRSLPKAESLNNSTTTRDSTTKRKLTGFSHSPSKKPRQQSVLVEDETDDEASQDTGTKAVSPPNAPLECLNTKEKALGDAPNDTNNPDAAVLEVVGTKPLDRFRQGSSRLKTAIPNASQTAKSSGAKSSGANSPGAKTSATKPAKLTPLEQQYKELKSLHMDKLLAIQVGYKYKFFGRDAEVASHLLSIMLIPGNLDLHDRSYDRYAYCLIPDNRLHIHLQRLLNHGLKVGVVKQTETAAVKSVESTNKSSLFQRKITAVYTKATYMGDEAGSGSGSGFGSDKYSSGSEIDGSGVGASDTHGGYILCVDELAHPGKTGMVAVQPATGDIVYDTFTDTLARDQLETRLAYLCPSEVIVIGSGDRPSKELNVVVKLQIPGASVSFVQGRDGESVRAFLAQFFGDLDASGKYAGLALHYTQTYEGCVASCVAQLVEHLAEFRLSNIFTITSNMAPFTESGKYMVLPASTLRALDIFQVHDDPLAKTGTLYWLVNHTHTLKGARMLRGWVGKPLVSRAEIQKRLDCVGSLASGSFVHVLDAFKALLAKIGKSGIDLDRLLIKIHYSATYNTEKVTRKELFLMLKCFSDVVQVFRNFGDKAMADVEAKFGHSELLSEILHSLLAASKLRTVDTMLAQINGGAALNDKDLTEQKTRFFVHKQNNKYAEITAEFDRIADIERQLDDELQAVRRLLKRPQLAYVTNVKDTHLIEVRNGKMVDSLPRDWLRVSGTKSVSRFRPPEVSRLHKLLQYHTERLTRACDGCFHRFLQEIDAEYEYLRQIVFNLARFDCLLSLSSLVHDEGTVKYVKPQLAEHQVIEIRLGCHPILLKLPQNTGAYVPNDVSMSYDKNKVLIITGPNMGGKSSLVKQIALFVILAQIGCFLPCAHATLGIFDSIHIRMGASDNILRGKSTFMVEMLECASIIKNYTLKSLVILDEIGRGTGTSDGIALAYSILKYIIDDDHGPLTLFITHYPSLHVLENEHKVVRNHHMAFIEKHFSCNKEHDWPEVVFLYKLVAGVVSNLYGLNVAKLAGISKDVIDQAHRVSEAMKADVERGQILRKLSQLTPENAFETLSSLVQAWC